MSNNITREQLDNLMSALNSFTTVASRMINQAAVAAGTPSDATNAVLASEMAIRQVNDAMSHGPPGTVVNDSLGLRPVMPTGQPQSAGALDVKTTTNQSTLIGQLPGESDAYNNIGSGNSTMYQAITDGRSGASDTQVVGGLSRGMIAGEHAATQNVANGQNMRSFESLDAAATNPMTQGFSNPMLKRAITSTSSLASGENNSGNVVKIVGDAPEPASKRVHGEEMNGAKEVQLIRDTNRVKSSLMANIRIIEDLQSTTNFMPLNVNANSALDFVRRNLYYKYYQYGNKPYEFINQLTGSTMMSTYIPTGSPSISGGWVSSSQYISDYAGSASPGNYEVVAVRRTGMLSTGRSVPLSSSALISNLSTIITQNNVSEYSTALRMNTRMTDMDALVMNFTDAALSYGVSGGYGFAYKACKLLGYYAMLFGRMTNTDSLVCTGIAAIDGGTYSNMINNQDTTVCYPFANAAIGNGSPTAPNTFDNQPIKVAWVTESEWAGMKLGTLYQNAAQGFGPSSWGNDCAVVLLQPEEAQRGDIVTLRTLQELEYPFGVRARTINWYYMQAGALATTPTPIAMNFPATGPNSLHRLALATIAGPQTNILYVILRMNNRPANFTINIGSLPNSFLTSVVTPVVPLANGALFPVGSSLYNSLINLSPASFNYEIDQWSKYYGTASVRSSVTRWAAINGVAWLHQNLVGVTQAGTKTKYTSTTTVYPAGINAPAIAEIPGDAWVVQTPSPVAGRSYGITAGTNCYPMDCFRTIALPFNYTDQHTSNWGWLEQGTLSYTTNLTRADPYVDWTVRRNITTLAEERPQTEVANIQQWLEAVYEEAHVLNLLYEYACTSLGLDGKFITNSTALFPAFMNGSATPAQVVQKQLWNVTATLAQIGIQYPEVSYNPMGADVVKHSGIYEGWVNVYFGGAPPAGDDLIGIRNIPIAAADRWAPDMMPLNPFLSLVPLDTTLYQVGPPGQAQPYWRVAPRSYKDVDEMLLMSKFLLYNDGQNINGNNAFAIFFDTGTQTVVTPILPVATPTWNWQVIIWTGNVLHADPWDGMITPKAQINLPYPMGAMAIRRSWIGAGARMDMLVVGPKELVVSRDGTASYPVLTSTDGVGGFMASAAPVPLNVALAINPESIDTV